MVDPIDFLGVLMGDKRSHSGSSVSRKNDSVLTDDTDCRRHFRTLIFDGLGFSNLSCVQLFFIVDHGFPKTERFAAESVSDDLKTFSPTVEPSRPGADAFDHSLSIQHLSRLTPMFSFLLHR